MINNIIQPSKIIVDSDLLLVKYFTNYKTTFKCYQDLTLCKQVDNVDHPYDMERLSKMYRFLSKMEDVIT